MNLYVHFPFCRRKCTYCALYSRTGVSASAREQYVRELAAAVERQTSSFSTIYFGGGSPALCDLRPLFAALQTSNLRRQTSNFEFTVELHPLDVTDAKLEELRAGGVNRISLGVEALDDRVLAAMGRDYTVDFALGAFEKIKRIFDNAGIDLIVGFPGAQSDELRRGNAHLERFAELGLRHASVYSLQNERGLQGVPDDDELLDRVKSAADALDALGFKRYEISNYAAPGCECRHNLAVWRGEDYLGLGEGACGRVGLTRTRGIRGKTAAVEYLTESVTPEFDLKERTLFRLRTREGLDASRFPEWHATLERFVRDGLLTRADPTAAIYTLTPRGTEVCDALLAELV